MLYQSQALAISFIKELNSIIGTNLKRRNTNDGEAHLMHSGLHNKMNLAQPLPTGSSASSSHFSLPAMDLEQLQVDFLEALLKAVQERNDHQRNKQFISRFSGTQNRQVATFPSGRHLLLPPHDALCAMDTSRPAPRGQGTSREEKDMRYLVEDQDDDQELEPTYRNNHKERSSSANVRVPLWRKIAEYLEHIQQMALDSVQQTPKPPTTAAYYRPSKRQAFADYYIAEAASRQQTSAEELDWAIWQQVEEYIQSLKLIIAKQRRMIKKLEVYKAIYEEQQRKVFSLEERTRHKKCAGKQNNLSSMTKAIKAATKRSSQSQTIKTTTIKPVETTTETAVTTDLQTQMTTSIELPSEVPQTDGPCMSCYIQVFSPGFVKDKKVKDAISDVDDESSAAQPTISGTPQSFLPQLIQKMIERAEVALGVKAKDIVLVSSAEADGKEEVATTVSEMPSTKEVSLHFLVSLIIQVCSNHLSCKWS